MRARRYPSKRLVLGASILFAYSSPSLDAFMTIVRREWVIVCKQFHRSWYQRRDLGHPAPGLIQSAGSWTVVVLIFRWISRRFSRKRPIA